MKYASVLTVFSLASSPAFAQDVAEFAAPCFVEDQSLETAVASFESFGWTTVEDETDWTRVAAALSVSRALAIRAPRGEVTPETMERFVVWATEFGRREYVANPDALVFEREEMVAGWQQSSTGSGRYNVFCNFAAPDIAHLTERMSDPREGYWFNGYGDVIPGEVYQTMVSGVRLIVGDELENTPAMRDGYFVSLNWREVPE